MSYVHMHACVSLQVRKLLQAHGMELRSGPEVVVADLGTAAAAAAVHLEQQRQQQEGSAYCWEFRSLAAAVAHVERSYLAGVFGLLFVALDLAMFGLLGVQQRHQHTCKDSGVSHHSCLHNPTLYSISMSYSCISKGPPALTRCQSGTFRSVRHTRG